MSDAHPLDRREAASRLRSLQPQIIREWESAVRDALPAAEGKPTPVLRDSLTAVLADLADTLESGTGSYDRGAAEKHADQRSQLPDYTLDQVIREYHMLEQITLAALEAERPLDSQAQQLIMTSVHHSVETAARRFSEAARQALRLVEQPYRMLVESTEDFAIFTMDPQGLITTWNPGAERIMGFTTEEALGQPGAIVFRPEDRAAGAPEQEIATALADGRAIDERWHQRKDGGQFFAAGVLTPMRDRELHGFVKVMRDVTERKRVEDERHWIVSGARCVLWSAEVSEKDDPQYLEWRQTFFSEDSAQRLLPLKLLPGESYQQAWYRCRVADDRERCDRTGTASIRAGRSYQQEFRMECSGDELRWIHEDVRVETVVPGHRWHVIGVATDMTDRKRLESELRDRARALSEADRRKNEFLAMLAHELRNPLGAIRSAIHIIQQAEPRSGPFERALEVAARQVRHQSQIVDDLLDLSRITQGKMELRREPVDLREVVKHSAEDLHRQVERQSLKLTLDLPDAPVPVRGDPTRLSQVVGNLLHNATKFTPARGEITVELSCDNAGNALRYRRLSQQQPLPPERQYSPALAVVRVRDTGIGIEPEVLERLFEPFTQADRTLDRARGGLGLGLALVKGLVEMHGGEVWAYSAGPGKGSEFTFYLPLDLSPEAPAALSTPGELAPLRILVVEDLLDAAESLRDLLELWGHRVEVAYSGTVGVEIAPAFQPQVVLCDIGLPGIDGYEVARRLAAELEPRPKLIALTGYSQEEDRALSAAAGFDMHLAKPVDPEELTRILASIAEYPKPG